MKDESQGAASADEYSSVDDCLPDEQGGPIARAGFAYQDHIAAELVLGMITDPAIEKIHCETMDDIVIVCEATNGSPRVAEFVQVKTTTKDSLWSCARLCGSAKDEPGVSVFEKSLAKDRVKERALFRIITSQSLHSSLHPLTYPRGHSARDLACPEMVALHNDIDKRCPNAVSLKGATSKDWLERTLWREGPTLEMLKLAMLLAIMIESSRDGGVALLVDQAEKVLLSLLAWVKSAGDAKFVPDKAKKIITRTDALRWWSTQLAHERSGASATSGTKLRKKMTLDVASPDMTEHALELRRSFSEEMRSPKYMEASEISALAIDVRGRLMMLRTRRFSGESEESPRAFHERCADAAAAAATARAEGDGVLRAMALGCLYDIVDRCQLDFMGGAG